MTTGDRSAGAADMIAVEAIGKTYGSGEHALEALVDVSFAVRRENSSPWSARAAAEVDAAANPRRPRTGLDRRVVISGRPVTGPAPDTIGVMFQDAWLLPWKTAVENVEFPLALRKVPAAVRRTRALPLIDLVGLTSFAHRYPDELSGGMRQRVAIARCLVQEPRVLLMDEPFAALDEQTRTRMGSELLQIWEKSGGTVVFVTHGLTEAIYLADTVFVMGTRPGRIIERITVPLPRPRTIDMIGSEAFGRLRNHIWHLIAEVRP